MTLGCLYKYVNDVTDNNRNKTYCYQWAGLHQYPWMLARSHQSGETGGLESAPGQAAMKLGCFVGTLGEGLLRLVGDRPQYVSSAQMHF